MNIKEVYLKHESLKHPKAHLLKKHGYIWQQQMKIVQPD